GCRDGGGAAPDLRGGRAPPWAGPRRFAATRPAPGTRRAPVCTPERTLSAGRGRSPAVGAGLPPRTLARDPFRAARRARPNRRGGRQRGGARRGGAPPEVVAAEAWP